MQEEDNVDLRTMLPTKQLSDGNRVFIPALDDVDEIYKTRMTRRHMLRYHSCGVLLVMCFVGSVQASCDAPSMSVECRHGQFVESNTGNSFQCKKCMQIICGLEQWPLFGDTIEHGTLSVIPESGKLYNPSDGFHHVVFGAMVCY